LITGATGFIGSRLALHAHRSGLDVIAVGRDASRVEKERADELRAAGVRLALGKLQETQFAASVVADCSAVIHLAAAQHEAQMPEAYFRDVNVIGTRVLLEAAQKAGVRRFVYGSTIGVYGSGADHVLDETSATHPDNPYTRSKLEAEGVVASFAQDLETCIVRIPETYGPSDFRLLKLFRAIDRGHFATIGPGLNRHQPMYVGDLIRMLLLAVEHPAAVGQLFVVAGAEALTTKEMIETIATVMRRRPPRLHLPLWPFTVAARACEAVFTPLGMHPPLHRRRLDFFTKSFMFSTAKAQEMLGFQPQVTFAAGAADTVSWYRAKGYLPPRETQAMAGAEST
jgi:dihydroflavonol-4-reductase